MRLQIAHLVGESLCQAATVQNAIPKYHRLHNANRGRAGGALCASNRRQKIWHGGCVAFIQKRDAMSDTIFLFTTLAFFALALAYTRACAWL
ncbi:MAG: hypothetical protein WCG85_09745 [Polyangia bacterium]